MKLSYKQEIILTKSFILITLFASFLFFREAILHLISAIINNDLYGIIRQGLFILIVTFLVYGNILYQLTRIGYFIRLINHQPISTNTLDTFAYDSIHIPKVVILIPSYKENLNTVRQTILSAAPNHLH